MNKIVKRILIGALVVSVPVGGSIFYFSTKSNDEEEANKKNPDVVEKDEQPSDGEDENKKDDNVDHPGTDAKISNPHKENIEKLKEEYNNDEIVGVVSIPGTSINSVVAQHSDNEYYLNHSLTGEENVEGSVYIDYRVDINSGRKNIIYGHNGDDSLLDVPFSELEKYYDKDFYNGHQYINLEDEDGVGTYQIFSVFVETRDPIYMYLNFKTDSAWSEHLDYLKNKSLYETGVSVDETDDVLILQTCSHSEEYIKYKDRYLLVVAKRVRYE